MKATSPILALLLVGCSGQSDAKLNKKLEGTWTLDRIKADGATFHSTTTIAAGGNYSCQTMERSGLNSSNGYFGDTLGGTFQIRDGYLYDTVTNAGMNPSYPVPSVFRGWIVRFDGSELVITDEVNSVQAVFRREKK